MLTAKIDKPRQVFCNANTLQGFFKISMEEVNLIKQSVCTDAFNNYVADLIKTFGVFDVKDKVRILTDTSLVFVINIFILPNLVNLFRSTKWHLFLSKKL